VPLCDRGNRLSSDTVNTTEAVELIAGAIPGPGGTWADLGAGNGTFTRALARLLGPNGRVYAVDRDVKAFESLRRSSAKGTSSIVPVLADLTRPFELPGLDGTLLDGMLIANTLHFVRDADAVLARLVAWVRPGGRVVLIEYDRRAASRWVPYPIPIAQLPALARSAGLSAPAIIATRPSAFGGTLYVAAADRAGPVRENP
jgi:ubiquinone/menaquinone biosynthesis C-methylase UbiE